MKPVLLCLLAALAAGQESPGARFFVPVSKLEGMKTLALSQLLDRAVGVRLPDFQVSAYLGILPVELTVRNLTIASLYISGPEAVAIVPVPPHRLHFEVSRISTLITFAWTTDYWLNPGGSGEISTHNTECAIGLTLSQAHGRLNIAHNVVVSVGEFDADIYESPLSWLYDIILMYKKDWLQSESERRIRALLSEQLTELFDALIGDPIYAVSSTPPIVGDFSLTADPAVSSRFIQFDLTCKFANSALSAVHFSMPNDIRDLYRLQISHESLGQWTAAADSAGLMRMALFPFMDNYRLDFDWCQRDLQTALNDLCGSREKYVDCVFAREGVASDIYGDLRVSCQIKAQGTEEQLLSSNCTEQLATISSIVYQSPWLRYDQHTLEIMPFFEPHVQVFWNASDLEYCGDEREVLIEILQLLGEQRLPARGIRLPIIAGAEFQLIEVHANNDYFELIAELEF